MPPFGSRKPLWLALAFLLALALPSPRALAQASSGSVDPGPVSNIITWDGTNGISINSLVGADRFYNVGIWGQSTVTANVEAGIIWNGHADTTTLSDYYVSPGASGAIDRHATWVGSVLAGYDPTVQGSYPYYKLGMAPLTTLSSGAIATGWYNNPSDPTDTTAYFDMTPKTFYSAYNHYFTQSWNRTISTIYGTYSGSAPTDVINSSWGYEDATGQDAYTRAVDGMARAHPLTTLVVAAGNSNDPTTNPSNNVGGPASGYNSISVGAVGNFTVDQFNSVATFSSRGPQDYYDPIHGLVRGVRAPVDIVAPGTSILAAYYGGQTGSNAPGLRGTQADNTNGSGDYYSIGVAGTSFASPIVAGGVSLLKSLSYALLMGDTSRDTRVIKSVLMNSATKLPGWDNGQHLNASGVTVTTQALDWAQGAGLLNLNRAFDQYTAGTQDVAGTGGGEIAKTGWDYGVISKGDTTVSHNDYPIHFTLQTGTIMDVTLSWFRNLGNPTLTDNADPSLQALTTTDGGFANLGLEIWNADFTHLYASSLSLYNATQQLHYTLTLDGQYGLRVIYADQMYGTPVPETYGLAWNVEEVPEPGAASLSFVAGVLVLVFHRKKKAAA